MGISKFLGVGAKVEVKATNLKPKSVLQAHFGNNYPTSKVQELVVIEGINDASGALVKIRCASPAFKSDATGNEIVFECKAGCCKVIVPAPLDLRFQVWC
jgi:hypothetical protein